MKACVVIPCYNEAQNVGRLLDQILALRPVFDVVVVDDNSPDGTADLVGEVAAREPRIHLIKRSGKLGYASAVATGLRFALDQGARCVGHMDADFSHQPRFLSQLRAAVESGQADVAVGSRYCRGGGTSGWGVARVLLSRGANLLARTLLGLHSHDCTSGFRCYQAQALERLEFERTTVDGYSFLIEMTRRAQACGLTLVQVPIVFVERRRGQSKISRRIVWEALGLVLRGAADRLRGRGH